MSIKKELDEWQNRLVTHFASLKERRKTHAGTQNPIFALEHGLPESDVQDFSNSLRAYITQAPPSDSHSLSWVVYAAELGYRYAGDEFWQTFERETPGWEKYGDRRWLRQRFCAFQETFDGAKPSGTWASHFSIICWPITHAILPKDLQRQFAQILYESRNWFTGEVLQSPLKLGELIKARAWSTTSRFQNFAQETQLVGQIAAALLFEEELHTNERIHPSTLERISQDLATERQGREWLRNARITAKRRIKVHGLGSGEGTSRGSRDIESARREVQRLGIEPRLILRAEDPQANTWTLHLELPDLSHLLHQFPIGSDALVSSRCTVLGSTGRPLARGRLLHGRQRIQLQSWPSETEVLLQFDPSNPQLDFLLRTECLLRPGSIRLFKVATDRLAYECRSLNVRPGSKYLLLNTDRIQEIREDVTRIDVDCRGISGVAFSLPSSLSIEWEDSISALGLSQARNLEVWPAGLEATSWDGEGHAEWLTSERPCIGIRTDFPLDQITLTDHSGYELVVDSTSIEQGQPIFVELSNLKIGRHRIHVAARSKSEFGLTELGDLHVNIVVRESSPWLATTGRNQLLEIQLEPPTASMEAIWNGDADISIAGAAKHRIHCYLNLYEHSRTDPISRFDIGVIALPVSVNQWREHFETQVKRSPAIVRAYDNASSCELLISGGELGECRIRCDREFTPLRWTLRRRAKNYELELLEVEESEEQVIVNRMSFQNPMIEEDVKLDSTIPANNNGGLYVARRGNFYTGKIVPPSDHSLNSLRFESVDEKLNRSLTSVLELIEKSYFWRTANLPGDFIASWQRRQVLLTLARQISIVICGASWRTPESSLDISNPQYKPNLRNELSRTPLGPELATLVQHEVDQYVTESCDDRVNRLITLVRSMKFFGSDFRTKEIPLKLICELALRLASDPGSVQQWAEKRVYDSVSLLMETPALLRLSRAIVLFMRSVTSKVDNVRGAPEAGWDWD